MLCKNADDVLLGLKVVTGDLNTATETNGPAFIIVTKLTDPCDINAFSALAACNQILALRFFCHTHARMHKLLSMICTLHASGRRRWHAVFGV
jgi:hypothetical protein